MMKNPYIAALVGAALPFVTLFVLLLLFQFYPNLEPNGKHWYMLGLIGNVILFRNLLRNPTTEKSGKVVLVITTIWTGTILFYLWDTI